MHASSEGELDTAFATVTQLRAAALLTGSDFFFNSRRDHIVALAARHAIPAIYEWRGFAAAGGLMSYGTSLAETYRQVGIYTGRILKGDKGTLPSCGTAQLPAEPVIRPGSGSTTARPNEI